jgi:very-short-patch-repair endonuclease
MRYKLATGRADHHVAEIAARQHGAISREQLLDAGLSAHTISRRVASGRLHRIHRGVYAVGHGQLDRYGRWVAAILAVPGSLLSHRSAAALWGMRAWSGPTEVTVRGRNGRAKRDRLIVHRSSTLARRQITRRFDLPVTTPARTITDLSAVVAPDQVHAAIRQAERLKLDLGDRIERDQTRSDLERDFLRFCRRHRLPKPQVNINIGPYYADFYWPEYSLVVETDTYLHHGTPSAFESDRERDLWLKLQGLTVVRVTDRQLRSDPKRLAANLRELMRRSGAS